MWHCIFIPTKYESLKKLQSEDTATRESFPELAMARIESVTQRFFGIFWMSETYFTLYVDFNTQNTHTPATWSETEWI